MAVDRNALARALFDAGRQVSPNADEHAFEDLTAEAQDRHARMALWLMARFDITPKRRQPDETPAQAARRGYKDQTMLEGPK